MANPVEIPKSIKLQEYGPKVSVPRKSIDLLALAEANRRWRKALALSNDPIRIEEAGNEHIDLRAEAVTGVVRCGKVDIEIAPKFLEEVTDEWQLVLWRILSAVEGGHIDSAFTSANETSAITIPDLLAEMFISSYGKGAARGLPRSYKSQQKIGSTLRGGLDTSRLATWVARPWELPFVADYLTDDTPLSRLLRWSASCLAATVKSPNRSRILRETVATLSHVGNRPPHLQDARRIKLGPQHSILGGAKFIGTLLLEGAGIHHSHGEHNLSGFLWNSDVIYENYIYWLCRRAASLCSLKVGKTAVFFGEVIAGRGSNLQTTPDVVFRDPMGTPIAVTDSKYKRLGSRPKAADTYQVLTAGHILGCDKVSLTYPVAEDRDLTTWKVSSALGARHIELSALPLNLMRLRHDSGQAHLISEIKSWLMDMNKHQTHLFKEASELDV